MLKEERRGFIAVIAAAITGWGVWLYNNSANAQLPQQTKSKPLQQPPVSPTRTSEFYVDTNSSPHDKNNYKQIRSHGTQIVGFTIMIMILIWIVEMIIEWLLFSKKELSEGSITRLNHAIGRFRVLKEKAVEKGCKAAGEITEWVRLEVEKG